MKHYSIISDCCFLIRKYRTYFPSALVLAALQIALTIIGSVMAVFLPKLVVDIVTGDSSYGLGGVVVFCLLYTLCEALCAGSGAKKYVFLNRMSMAFLAELFLKSLKLPYEQGEHGVVNENYWKAVSSLNRGDNSAVPKMSFAGVEILINGISFFMYASFISVLNFPILLGLIVLSLINSSAHVYQIRYIEKNRDEEAKLERQYWCIADSIGNTEHAKDIRLFEMDGWLSGLKDGIVEKMAAFFLRKGKKASFVEKVGFTTAFIRNVVAYGYLIFLAVSGEVSMGNFVLYLGAIQGFSQFVESLLRNITDLRDAANGMDHIRGYLELPDDKNSEGRGIEDLEQPVEIEFRDVSYAYGPNKEGETKKIFEHFNCKIKAGERIALVGANGAGKTTFVNILTGMYEPQKGQILINGIDRREFSKMEYYKLFSAVFQEHLILPFTVKENITLQRVTEGDDEKVWDAIKRAGLEAVFKEKKIGLKTYVTRAIMKGGVRFSGGQYQRLLLARALYKDAPVLVLDEPTAALDPIAESEIYDIYAQYTRKKTAVFISHRFASTRFSDRIFMLENGRIIEEGTHEELMEQQGKYAEMFRVQSNYYEETGKG